jgi:hypothetical protein
MLGATSTANHTTAALRQQQLSETSTSTHHPTLYLST